MKRMTMAFAGLLCAGSALAQSAEPLDLRLPEAPVAAATSQPRDPPGTYYGDTSGTPSRGGQRETKVVDDGKAKVWGSVTTGIGYSKGYGTSHYNAADLNVSKSFGDGERPSTVNLQIHVEKGDGPGFGDRYYPSPYFDRGVDYPPPR